MEFKATDIAAFLNGEVVGNEDVKVFNVSKIEEGKPGTLAFLANLKYEHYIYVTKASIVLVNKTFEPRKEISATLIKVDDAYQAFASLLELVQQAKSTQKTGVENPSFIHETASVGNDIYLGAFAYIGKNSKIGDNVKIYPQAFVGDNVTIGDNCIIYAGVKIYDDCKIGNQCILHAGCVIGSDGFGFAPQPDGTYNKIPQLGNVILEDNVEIGANTTIDCGTMESTIIRKGVKLDNLVQVAHNCEIGENTVIAAQAGMAGTTKIGKNCRLGGQVGLAGHLTIGNNVQIGAQSGLSSSVKDNETLLMTPAFNIKDAVKSAIIFKKLPELREDVIQLKREVKSLKENK
ncbi:UDP-3-O-(3-hydroxymyristoyl)glucosamine N-acyltransferase [Maribellus comscasis]|uniref:UDP-3-O-acylglucosamine N-acyltransferase n=1 Tax=Maribellus comscasis TaxID=2681766 RepID=A0A6I6JTT2_9BACT|nr:UDP-3-O-(3-hydroxymyristoyl)glucosamine N-acyltransferase [Maribellus comscasis]QGY43552.1 UDP-3-O-(3-hydroxymyristoyl)glucosamine N-acyltransferase [Maribellus comscasis]